MSTLTIARLTFQEAVRRRIVLAALLLGLAFLVIYSLGFHYLIEDMVNATRRPATVLQVREVSNFLLLAGLYVVNFLTVMMTVLTSVDTLSGEINSGTIHTLLSKPVRRWEIVLGKWLGFAGMLTLYLLLMAGGVILSIYLQVSYLPPRPVNAFLLMWLNALLLLSVSLLGGARFSTLANGVLVLGLWGIAFIGSWVEQIGTFTRDFTTSQTAINIGILTSLLLPSEALWRKAAAELESPLLNIVGFSPFGTTSVPSALMIWYAGLYLAVALALAVRQFNRRDL